MTEMQRKLVERVPGMATAEYERSRREDWDEEYEDRRQEIVFIGQRMDEPEIRTLLDGCLLTDEEMVGYKKRQEDDAKDSKKVQEESFAGYNSD